MYLAGGELGADDATQSFWDSVVNSVTGSPTSPLVQTLPWNPVPLLSTTAQSSMPTSSATANMPAVESSPDTLKITLRKLAAPAGIIALIVGALYLASGD